MIEDNPRPESIVRFLLDQGLDARSVPALHVYGYDAVHVSTIGMAGSSDEAILEHARDEGRVVATLDADFHRLLAVSGESSPSVIRFRIE